MAPGGNIHWHPNPQILTDTFGGIAAPQEVVAAIESSNEAARAVAESVISTSYAPVITVHWVTVR